ncbi:MAG TPA: S9 family peptidase [Candidatus Binatia bacterium]|nr:S9 family peptidase [Candidatus Binatia bacterium]
MATVEGRGFEIEDLLQLKSLEDIQLSPDGALVAYVQREIDAKRDTYRSSIWLVAADGSRAPLQFTRGPQSDSAPRWSPDGTQLAFLSDRSGGRPQLFVIPLGGGEPRQLTSLAAGAGEPVWSPDGSRIAFAAPVVWEAPPKDKDKFEAWRQRPKVIDRALYKFDGTGFLLHGRLQLFVVSVEGGEPVQLTRDDCTHWQPAWSPDGRRIAYACSRTGVMEAHRFDIWTIATDGSNATQLTEHPATASLPSWSPDGKSIAFYGSENEADLHSWVWTVAAAGGRARAHTAEFDREVPALPGLMSPPPTWSADGAALYFSVADAGNVHLTRCDLTGGEVRKVISGERYALQPSVRPAARRLAFLTSGPTAPWDVAVAALDGSDERQLTHVNDAVLSGVVLPTIERRTFKSPHGGTIDGFVVHPTSTRRPAPLLLDIHGGPQGFVGAVFPRVTYWLVLAARGWVILALNPSGSGSYGRACNHSLRFRWGEHDLPEQMAAVDALIAAGVADPDRLAVAGYSYGGYMTAWMIAHSDRFKAAVVGAPLTNLESASGTQDLGSFMDEWNFGNFFTDRETYRRLSPLTYADRVTTPTLLLHGEADDRCPIGQSEEFFTALMLSGKAPAQFVRYPGGSHAFVVRGRPSHRVDYSRRVVEWLEHWTLGRSD